VTPRQHVFAALHHKEADRVPRFEIWIDGLLHEPGQTDPASAYVNLRQDGVMMPTKSPEGSNVWKTGIDEWGRVWESGQYVTGVLETEDDLSRYSHPASYADEHFDCGHVTEVQARYPDHCHIYGSHDVGPLTISYMAMGMERFFLRLIEDPSFVHRLLTNRTDWCVAMCRRAVNLGAEVLIIGDDGARGAGPMISPRTWREFVLPCHRRLVDSVDVPVFWHSDGNTESLLPFAMEAGFAGVHGLQPSAGMDLGRIKAEYGDDLVLVGNLDLAVLFEPDLEAVRAEVDRCLEQGSRGGGTARCTS